MIETMVFPCTYKCNAKCIMCSIHERKNSDLSVKEFERFFSDERLYNLKSINITGGEPTLRADLPKLVEMILDKCPLINEILINSNGLLPDLIYSQVERILNLSCDNIKLWVFVSVDALDDKAEYIRGVSKAGEKACETIEKLKSLRTDMPIWRYQFLVLFLRQITTDCKLYTIMPRNREYVSTLYTQQSILRI